MMDAQKILQEAGVFATPQRKAVAKILFAKHQHLTADEVFMKVNHSAGSVSRATIYNTLSLFSDKGLLKEISVDTARTFYDSNAQPHFHLYNVDSHELTDMEDHPAAQRLAERVPEGASLVGVEVVVRVRNRRDRPL